MSLARALGPLLIAVTLCTAGGARADAYDAALTRAVAAKESALDVNEPARWLEALRLFQQADAIRSSGETKYELGYAAAQLRQYDLAVESYREAIALGLGDAALARAKAFVAEHAPALSELLVTGRAGTELYIADLFRGKLPLDKALVVFSGAIEIEAVHGEERQMHTVRLAPGATRSLELEPAKALEPPRTLPMAAAAPPDRAPPAVHVQDGSSGPWILVATGTLLTVSGGVFAAVSHDRVDTARSELEPLCAEADGPDACAHAEPGQRDSAQDVVDRIATWKALRLGSYVTGGVGIATLVVGTVLLANRPSSRPASARSSPALELTVPPPGAGLEGLTLRLSGEF